MFHAQNNSVRLKILAFAQKTQPTNTSL